ncbi:Carbohydrate sulfotransferase 15 [Bagarius yarrelli]|uniref:Carbohydrate sulfotransferase 15 n=1 Tax=Bagarius yarrelli TaxID=175774 RepID=A0A556V9M2_BAGYA|nr:Carbohydrate sulfotransferase 15 [Bagarius yarrelli]
MNTVRCLRKLADFLFFFMEEAQKSGPGSRSGIPSRFSLRLHNQYFPLSPDSHGFELSWPQHHSPYTSTGATASFWLEMKPDLIPHCFAVSLRMEWSLLHTFPVELFTSYLLAHHQKLLRSTDKNARRTMGRRGIYSFVLVLAVVFLISASYMLSSDSVFFFLTSPPYHRTLPFNLSTSEDSAHIVQVLHRIHNNLQFIPRKVPDRDTLIHSIFQPYEGLHDPVPLEHYLDLFDHSAQQIQTQLLTNQTAGHHRADFITGNVTRRLGEASASTMWDNNAWFYINGNTNTTELEPPILTQDLIHALQPHTRLIIILRDPVERSRGPMLPHTHCVLTTFYAPFNRKLANILNDTSFLWEEHNTHC